MVEKSKPAICGESEQKHCKKLNESDDMCENPQPQVELYTDGKCAGAALRGRPIASGSSEVGLPELAMDRNLGTYWEADCVKCPKYAAWIGLDLFAERGAHDRGWVLHVCISKL